MTEVISEVRQEPVIDICVGRNSIHYSDCYGVHSLSYRNLNHKDLIPDQSVHCPKELRGTHEFGVRIVSDKEFLYVGCPGLDSKYNGRVLIYDIRELGKPKYYRTINSVVDDHTFGRGLKLHNGVVRMYGDKSIVDYSGTHMNIQIGKRVIPGCITKGCQSVNIEEYELTVEEVSKGYQVTLTNVSSKANPAAITA